MMTLRLYILFACIAFCSARYFFIWNAHRSSPANMNRVKVSLQRAIGRNPAVSIESFSNWGGNIKIIHAFKVSPTTKNEIKKVVLAARIVGLTIRCAGGGHSWSPLFSDENQILMDMTQLTRTPRMTFNRQDMTVTAAASVRQREALKFYNLHGISSKAASQPEVDTLGGILSTASHGSDVHKSAVARDYFREVKFIDGLGNERVVNGESDVEDLQAVGGFSLFGAVYEITFEVQPMRFIDVTRTIKKLALFSNSAQLKSLLESHASVDINWTPMNSIALEKSLKHYNPRWNPDDDEIDVNLYKYSNQSRSASSISENCSPFQTISEEFTSEVSSFYSGKLSRDVRKFPVIARLLHEVVVKPENSPSDVPETLPLPKSYHYLDRNGGYSSETGLILTLELGIAIDTEYKVVGQVKDTIVKTLQIYATANKFPLVLMVLRFARSSSSFSSHVYNAEDKVHFSFDLVGGNENTLDYSSFLTDVWYKLRALGHSPKVHAGKNWQYIHDYKGVVRSVMGEQLDKIKAVRDKLGADPHNIFTNRHLRHLFNL